MSCLFNIIGEDRSLHPVGLMAAQGRAAFGTNWICCARAAKRAFIRCRGSWQSKPVKQVGQYPVPQILALPIEVGCKSKSAAIPEGVASIFSAAARPAFEDPRTARDLFRVSLKLSPP
jgi:hypothetical protein